MPIFFLIFYLQKILWRVYIKLNRGRAVIKSDSYNLRLIIFIIELYIQTFHSILAIKLSNFREQRSLVLNGKPNVKMYHQCESSNVTEIQSNPMYPAEISCNITLNGRVNFLADINITDKSIKSVPSNVLLSRKNIYSKLEMPTVIIKCLLSWS